MTEHLPEPLIRHPGSRQAPSPPHLVRSIKKMQRQLDDTRWQVPPQELHPADVSVTAGKACTGSSFAALYRMWTYRNGASVFADVAVGCGTGSVVQARLTVPDFSLNGTPAVSAAGGEQVLRLSLPVPDAWPPGEAHYVTVQAFRASGTDATTLQVLRAWQR